MCSGQRTTVGSRVVPLPRPFSPDHMIWLDCKFCSPSDGARGVLIAFSYQRPTAEPPPWPRYGRLTPSLFLRLDLKPNALRKLIVSNLFLSQLCCYSKAIRVHWGDSPYWFIAACLHLSCSDFGGHRLISLTPFLCNFAFPSLTLVPISLNFCLAS